MSYKNVSSRISARGFTLIEMLVSALIFSFVMIGVLYMFDRGKWLYFHSEKRTNLQENGRIVLEDIERNLRMAGLGIPTGTRIDGTAPNPELTFLPYIFIAGESKIGFRGDVDNRNSMFAANAAANSSNITVQTPSIGCPTNIIVVQRGRSWEPFTCSNPAVTSPGTIDVTPNTPDDFEAAECEVYSPEHVFYRLTPDADSNGVCDVTDDFSQCLVEKCERLTNTPQTDESGCQYATIGTNVKELHFDYYEGFDLIDPIAAPPLTTAQTPFVDLVRITLIVRDRADRVQTFQDLQFVSDVFVRKQGL